MKKLMKITTITILLFFAGYHINFSMPKASQDPKGPAPFQAAPALQTNTSSAAAPTIPTSATNPGIPTQTPPQDSGPQQQALSEVKKTMEEINTLKDDLKNKLKELDAKLYEARKAAVEGKKVSFEILQQDGQRSARDTFDKVKEKLTTIKNTQTFVQSAFTRDFNQKIADFNSLITKLQSKTQAFAAIKALPQQPVQAQAAATQTSQVKTASTQTKPAASSNSQQLQEQLPMFDSLVKEIDTTRLQLNERYQDIKKTQKIVYTHLQQYPELQDSMQTPSKHLHESDTIKKWKNTMIIIFTKNIIFYAAALFLTSNEG